MDRRHTSIFDAPEFVCDDLLIQSNIPEDREAKHFCKVCHYKTNKCTCLKIDRKMDESENLARTRYKAYVAPQWRASTAVAL